MVGFLLVTHGELGQSLLEAARMLGAETEGILPVSLGHMEGPEEFEKKVAEAVRKADQGEGVVALVDLLGGTPFNTAFRVAQEYPVSVIAGVNLPIILAAILECADGESREQIADKLSEMGREQIRVYGRITMEEA